MQGIPVDKMEEETKVPLYEPHQPETCIRTSGTLAELLPALIKARAAIPSFGKGAQGQSGNQKYKYAPLDIVLDAVMPHLLKNNLMLVQAPQVLGTMVYVDTKLFHASGQWIGCSVSCQTEDAGPKALGSAITYLRRYSVQPLLMIQPDSDDDGTAAGSRPNQAPPQRPRQQQQARGEGTPSSELSEECKKTVQEMREEIATITGGDEQRSRAISKRVSRFKSREGRWFEGYDNVLYIKSDKMARMAAHNLGELINNEISLDDPMD